MPFVIGPYLRNLFWRSARKLYLFSPIRFSGAVAVIPDGGRFLVIDRADRLGYCFPGGLSKRGEPEQETIRRELLEETGLALASARFLFRYPETGGFSEFTSVYEATATGEIRPSSEGVPLWLTLAEIQARPYPPQAPVLDYIRNSNE